MPIFAAKQRPSITDAYSQTVPQVVDIVRSKLDVATSSRARREVDGEEISLYDPEDSDPFMYQQHSLTTSSELQIDPSTSFASISDTSIDGLPISSPINGPDYSILSLSPVGDDASFYARIHGGEVGGLAFLEKELIGQVHQPDQSSKEESNTKLLGIDIAITSEDCTSANADLEVMSLNGDAKRRSVTTNYTPLRTCFPSANLGLILDDAPTEVESTCTTEPFLGGLGIHVLTESCSGLLPKTSPARPSKIPRWVSAPSWSSSHFSIELQRTGLGEREASFASSIATTLSIGSTSPLQQQPKVQNAPSANPLSPGFTMVTHDPVRKKKGIKWFEPTMYKLRKMTSWRQGSSSEGSKAGISSEYEPVQRRPLVPRSASNKESTFYYSQLDSPSITLTVRSLSMPTFTSRWSVDWDTVLAGISYDDDDDAPKEVDYFSCKAIRATPSAASFEVTLTPMSQGAVQLRTPPAQPRHRPSQIQPPNKGSRRNAGFFDLDVTSLEVSPCVRSAIPRFNRNALATEGVTRSVMRPFNARTQSVPIMGSLSSNRRLSCASSCISRIPRPSPQPSTKSSVMLAISSTIDSFPEPPGCRFGRSQSIIDVSNKQHTGS